MKFKFKHGFSLVEVMIIFVILSVILAAAVPMITRRSSGIPERKVHGVYKCIPQVDEKGDYTGKFYESQYNANSLVKQNEEVTECTFAPPENAAVFKIDLYGAGAGGYDNAQISLHSGNSGHNTEKKYFFMGDDLTDSKGDQLFNLDNSMLETFFKGQVVKIYHKLGDAGQGQSIHGKATPMGSEIFCTLTDPVYKEIPQETRAYLKEHWEALRGNENGSNTTTRFNCRTYSDTDPAVNCKDDKDFELITNMFAGTVTSGGVSSTIANHLLEIYAGRVITAKHDNYIDNYCRSLSIYNDDFIKLQIENGASGWEKCRYNTKDPNNAAKETINEGCNIIYYNGSRYRYWPDTSDSNSGSFGSLPTGDSTYNGGKSLSATGGKAGVGGYIVHEYEIKAPSQARISSKLTDRRISDNDWAGWLKTLREGTDWGWASKKVENAEKKNVPHTKPSSKTMVTHQPSSPIRHAEILNSNGEPDIASSEAFLSKNYGQVKNPETDFSDSAALDGDMSTTGYDYSYGSSSTTKQIKYSNEFENKKFNAYRKHNGELRRGYVAADGGDAAYWGAVRSPYMDDYIYNDTRATGGEGGFWTQDDQNDGSTQTLFDSRKTGAIDYRQNNIDYAQFLAPAFINNHLIYRGALMLPGKDGSNATVTEKTYNDTTKGDKKTYWLKSSSSTLYSSTSAPDRSNYPYSDSYPSSSDGGMRAPYLEYISKITIRKHTVGHAGGNGAHSGPHQKPTLVGPCTIKIGLPGPAYDPNSPDYTDVEGYMEKYGSLMSTTIKCEDFEETAKGGVPDIGTEYKNFYWTTANEAKVTETYTPFAITKDDSFWNKLVNTRVTTLITKSTWYKHANKESDKEIGTGGRGPQIQDFCVKPAGKFVVTGKDLTKTVKPNPLTYEYTKENGLLDKCMYPETVDNVNQAYKNRTAMPEDSLVKMIHARPGSPGAVNITW